MSTVAVIPSLEQWRLMNLLHRQGLNASQALNQTNARASDLGELAEVGWVEGVRDGRDADLVNEWHHSLAYVYVRLTQEGITWVTRNPQNATLRALRVRASGDAYARVLAVAVEVDDDMFMWLAGKRLITLFDTDRRQLSPDRPPSKQITGTHLLISLTQRGEQLLNP